jgi:cytochrome c-type biogenesis protein CcmH/NrfG
MPQTGSEQQKPDKINNSLKLAKLYMGIGSYDDAIAQYLDVLMLDPANQEARDGLVKARETKKNTLGK